MTPGAHRIVIGQDHDAYKARSQGWQLRDAILILAPGPQTLTAFLFRWPPEGTMTDTVLEHEAGGLYIDGCRIGSGGEKYNRAPACSGFSGIAGYVPGSGRQTGVSGSGRWPSNLLLVHGQGCVRVGTKRVQAHAAFGKPGDSKGGILNKTGAARKNPHPGFADPEGKETVPAYDCEPDCPVRLLDESCYIKPAHFGDKGTGMGFHGDDKPRGAAGYTDSGGASRFYPQFKSLEQAIGWLDQLTRGPQP